MRWTAALAALIVISCAPRSEPDLNPLAESYVRLALEMGTHEDGYIDAYFGPPEWKTEAEAHPRAIPELKTDIDELSANIATALAQAHDPQVQRRARTLAGYVRSARFRLDMMEGARVPFADEAERLFALRPSLRPLASYDAALARVEAIAPGSGPLWRRLDAFDRRYIIPRDKLQPVMEAAIAECRRRTLEHIPLPQNERFELAFVSNQPWGAYNYYQGQNHSLIQVNTDLPSNIGSALLLGCHEGYPGHHVQGIYAEKLYRERGYAEFSVVPLYSPQGPLNEGGGDYGLELAFPGDEQIAFERDVLYPLAGLDPASAAAYDAMRKARHDLGSADITIDQQYLDGQITRVQAAELLQRYALMSPERAEHTLHFADTYRSYVINYVSGEELIQAFANRQGADNDAHWRAYMSILNQPVLPSDLQ